MAAETTAALAALWRMAVHHCTSLYCYWDLGIGGGLLLGDEARRSMTDNFVEIAHVVAEPDGRLLRLRRHRLPRGS